MGTGDGSLREASASRATMRDVAALAGVSIKTVSRVVNGEDRVSDGVTGRVLSAIERLNYRHNLAASRLRSGSANAAAIGLLVVDIGNPFSSRLHRAVEDAARTGGLVVLAASTDEDRERERDAVAAFTTRRVDGLIMMPSSHDQSYLLADIATGTPVVMIDRPPAFLDVDAVVSDNVGGAREGVGWLVARGHRRIGYLGDRGDIFSARERYQGYRRALDDAGIASDDVLVRQGFPTANDVGAAVRELLAAPHPPTALFLGQNLICAPTVRALRALGRHRDVAVIGFDGFDGADLVEPGLTTVEQDPTEMGRRAAEVLFRRMNGERGETAVLTLPTRLWPRGSGEIGATG